MIVTYEASLLKPHRSSLPNGAREDTAQSIPTQLEGATQSHLALPSHSAEDEFERNDSDHVYAGPVRPVNIQ